MGRGIPTERALVGVGCGPIIRRQIRNVGSNVSCRLATVGGRKRRERAAEMNLYDLRR